MLTSDRATDPAAPEDLEDGERAVAPPWRVIVWGSQQPLSGGPLTITDRYVRFTPAWSKFDALIPSPSSRSAPPLKLPRPPPGRVRWDRTAFFLRSLCVDLPDGRELSILASREVMTAVAAALGVES